MRGRVVCAGSELTDVRGAGYELVLPFGHSRAAEALKRLPAGKLPAGVAYARVMAELRLRISLVVWRFNAYSAHRLVGAVARRVAGGGVDFLPSVGKGGLGGGHGAAAGG